MKGISFFIATITVGLISKDSMTKYLLVEVNGSRGTDAPVDSIFDEQCKGKKCGGPCLLPIMIPAACDVNEKCVSRLVAQKGCQENLSPSRDDGLCIPGLCGCGDLGPLKCRDEEKCWNGCCIWCPQ